MRAQPPLIYYTAGMTTRLFIVVFFASALTNLAQTPQSLADAELPSLLTIDKDIHSHPELSGHEERTAGLVAKELRAAGCKVTYPHKTKDPTVCSAEIINALQRIFQPKTSFDQ